MEQILIGRCVLLEGKGLRGLAELASQRVCLFFSAKKELAFKMSNSLFCLFHPLATGAPRTAVICRLIDREKFAGQWLSETSLYM